MGVSFYVGMTQSGKTHLALEHLKAAIVENGNPALILNMIGAQNFLGMPHETSVDAVLGKVYGSPRTNALYRPKGEEETAQILRAINDDRLGGVNVLIDEIYWVPCKPHQILPELSLALRGWRHHLLGPNEFYLTSQRPGDLHGDGYAAREKLFIFRPSEGRDVDRLVKDFGQEKEKLLALKAREYILLRNEIAA